MMVYYKYFRNSLFKADWLGIIWQASGSHRLMWYWSIDCHNCICSYTLYCYSSPHLLILYTYSPILFWAAWSDQPSWSLFEEIHGWSYCANSKRDFLHLFIFYYLNLFSFLLWFCYCNLIYWWWSWVSSLQLSYPSWWEWPLTIFEEIMTPMIEDSHQ